MGGQLSNMTTCLDDEEGSEDDFNFDSDDEDGGEFEALEQSEGSCS